MLFDVIFKNYKLIVIGLKYTAGIFILSFSIGLIIGIFTAVLRMSSIKFLNWFLMGYVEIVRNTPLLVQVFFVWLGLPLLNIRISGFVSVILALAINNGAYLSEIIRGGLQSIPKFQLEAAASLGLSFRTTFVQVVLPQTFRAILPALMNQMISTLLGSSVGSVVGSPELTQQIFYLNSRTYRTIELLIFLSGTYALFTYAFTRMGRSLDQKIGWTNK